MKERPIIFSAPMVKAILAGRKSQTRRILKPQPSAHHGIAKCWGTSPDGVEFGEKYVWTECGPDYPDGPEDERRSPYGVPGDRLWVRETHCPRYFDDGKPGYRADWSSAAADLCPEPKWKPSIFMRRHDSRITLEVTDVRVERLQTITEADAIAEGTERHVCGALKYSHPGCCGHVRAFELGWDSINAKRGSWASNPWVWVVSFRVVQP